MPYLASKHERERIESWVKDLDPKEMDAAELNFTICTLLNEFVQGMHGRSFSYARINEASGAVLLGFLQWHTRCVLPYEDAKAMINGDLPWPQG